MLAIFMLAFLPLGDVEKSPPKRESLPMPVESIEEIYRSVAMEGGKSQVSAVSVVKAGEAFIVQWNTGATGVGIRTGDTLSVGWTQESGGKLFRGSLSTESRGGDWWAGGRRCRGCGYRMKR